MDLSLLFCLFLVLAGHLLGVVASWLIQVGIEIYRLFSNESEDDEDVDKAEKLQLFKKKVSSATVRCSASLVFASIGAGIGASLFRPSTGQWIGKHQVTNFHLKLISYLPY